MFLSACGGSDTATETQSPADTTAPIITLNGDSNITLTLNENYNEQGASATDDRDGSVEVVISGTVDASTLDSYTITYTATDNANNTSNITRTVEVVLPPDTTAPVITLNGESQISIFINESYSELGASAIDDRDGSVDVVISGSVDSSTLGSYTLTYTATDNANNTNTITRTVDVVLSPPLIYDLTIGAELIELGYQLRADITCIECLPDNHQYSWTIDGEVVSIGQTYLLTSDFFDKKIQVEVLVSSEDNLTSTTYQTYIPNSVQVIDIYSIPNGFAALKNDGSVVTWGACHSVVPDVGAIKDIHLYDGTITVLTTSSAIVTWDCIDDGAEVNRDLTNVADLFHNGYAFAALKNDGAVVTWGHSARGGDSSSVANSLTNVTEILYSSRAFAALKSDGSVVTWGEGDYGGDSSSVSDNLTSIVEVVPNNQAFAALKNDGSVVTWGSNTDGGDSSSVASNLTNVVEIRSLEAGFSILKSDNSAVIWGDEYLAHSNIFDLTNVVDIYYNGESYAALKADGSITFSGALSVNDDITDVAEIYSTYLYFYVIKHDRSMVSFTNDGDGYFSYFGVSGTNVERLFMGGDQVSILTNDGSVITSSRDYTNETHNFSNVIYMVTTGASHAILKSDGTLVKWDTYHYGADDQTVTNVVNIYSNDRAYAALKNTGVVVTLDGDTYSDYNLGGDSSTVTDDLLPAITLTDVSNAPLLRFNGDKEITLELNGTYTELGVTAKDDIDDTVQVIVSGTVDTATAGVYTITYTASDSNSNEASITRTINVVLP